MTRKLNKKKHEIIIQCNCPQEIRETNEKLKAEFNDLSSGHEVRLMNIEKRIACEIKSMQNEIRNSLKISEDLHERNPVFRILCRLGFIKYKPIEQDNIENRNTDQT